MRLADAEFRAMNGGLRRFFHERVEFPVLLRLGLDESSDKDVLELGCGNGFGAELIARLRPRSYTGIDFMPEQIALAVRRQLAGVRFSVGDASAVDLPDASVDVIVIFGVLHHVERWREALAECARLLRAGGVLVGEEPDGTLLRQWDRLFRWGHPDAGFSLRGLEEELQRRGLGLERRVRIPGVFGAYCARKPFIALT